MREKICNIVPYLILILLALTITGSISAITLFVIIISLNCLLSRKEVGISFLLIFPALMGQLFRNLQIGYPGSIIALIIGIGLLKNELRTIFKRPSALLYTCTLVMIILISFIYGGMTIEGTDKLITLLITCITSILIFYPIAMSRNIDLGKIAYPFLLSGIFFIAVAYDFLGYTRTYDFFDFTTFRQIGTENLEKGLPYIVWHIPAMISCYSLAFYLSGKDDSVKFKDIIFLITSFWLILLSGTRQAIICYFAILVCWIIIRNGKLQIKDIVISVFLCLAGYLFFSTLEVEGIQKVFDTTKSLDERLNRDYSYTFKLISENTYLGVGLGNINDPLTGQRYPHNIVLEILCEMGCVGLIAVSLLIIIFYARNKFDIFKKTNSGNYSLILFLPYLVRSMISDDLSHNVVLFVVMFTLFNRSANIKSIVKKCM